MLQQFDATYRLSELTTAWASFVTSFGEKLQVSFSEVLSLDVRLSSVLMSYFSLFLIHILIIEFPYHLVDPRLPLTLSRPLVSPLVHPYVLSLGTRNVRSARWL